MTRARTLTREDLLRRYAIAMSVPIETVIARAHGFNNEELRDVVEQAERRPAGRRARWQRGQTTTVQGLTR